MRWGYVVGPLILVPLLGSLFLIPRPGGDGRLRFDPAGLSLLVCHTPGVALVSLPGDEPVRPFEAEDSRLRAAVER